MQPMDDALKQKMIDVCNAKIAAKGENVGVSFYAFLSIKTTTLSYSCKPHNGEF